MDSLKDQICVVGIGETPYKRLEKPDGTNLSIQLKACEAAIADAEKSLKGKGRVLVRYSGTQPQCRVMVEGTTEEDTRRCCRQIADIIRKKIGI